MQADSSRRGMAFAGPALLLGVEFIAPSALGGFVVVDASPL